MSKDFKTVLVTDDRIGNLTDELTFAVKKGAQQSTVFPYRSISANTSQIVFNVQVPSRTTILDRRFMLQATIALDIASPAALTADQIAQISLGPFPFQSLFSTMSMTVNSNTITVNINDVLPALLTMLDSRELSRYNGATPNMRDSYAVYADAVGKVNSPFAGWESCVDYDLATRGSYSLDSVSAYDVGTNKTRFVYTISEPFLLSPCIWGNPKTNNGGIYGITNLSLLFNVSGVNRTIRFPEGLAGITSVAFSSVSPIDPGTTKLYINYLTPHPSQLLSSKCAVSYYDIPRYISPVSFSGLAGGVLPTAVLDARGKFNNPTSSVISSQSLQLNSIPDKLIIFVRHNGTPTNSTPDRFLAISNITVNWNNMSGVLSSFSQQDLWRNSVDAGSNLAFNEFRGFASALAPTVTAPGGAGACAVTQTKTDVGLCGSVLVLDMGRTIALVNDFDAPGSLGSYNLQFNLTVQNYTGTDLASAEIVLITMNSGVMITEQGSSSVLTAILDKQTVLETSEQESYSYSQYRRQVGGGFLDTLKSVGKALLPVARKLVAEVDHPYAKKADSALKMLGLGHSAGGVGFGASGGALRRKMH